MGPSRANPIVSFVAIFLKDFFLIDGQESDFINVRRVYFFLHKMN